MIEHAVAFVADVGVGHAAVADQTVDVVERNRGLGASTIAAADGSVVKGLRDFLRYHQHRTIVIVEVVSEHVGEAKDRRDVGLDCNVDRDADRVGIGVGVGVGVVITIQVEIVVTIEIAVAVAVEVCVVAA